MLKNYPDINFYTDDWWVRGKTGERKDYTPTHPTLDEIRSRVNGRQRRRTQLTIATDTVLKIDGDDVVIQWLQCANWSEPLQEHSTDFIRYTPTHLEVTMPKMGGNMYALSTRLVPVLGEYGIYSGAIYRGKNAGTFGWSTENPFAVAGLERAGYYADREEYHSFWIKHSYHWIPLPRGETSLIGYDGTDISKRGEGREKDLSASLKRSKASVRTHRLFKILGFYSSFEAEGYKLPSGLTEETALELNKMAVQLGYNTVRDAWVDRVPIFDQLDDDTMLMIREGLGAMYVDFLRSKP